MSESSHVIIIGNGVAGITAARYIRKQSDFPITVISAESKHFFSRTALMYIYMGHMTFEDTKPYEDYFWEKNRINLIQAYVEKVNPQGKTIELSNGKTIPFGKLILATGSRFNKFGWPGQDLDGVGGLYSLQDLDYMEAYTHDIKRAVIVGGGLIGIEMAEMLRSRNIEVTMLVREKNYWDNVLAVEESKMVNRHIAEHYIDLRLETELKEILPDENGRVRAVITNKSEEITCGFVGLTAGVYPNVEFLKDSGINLGRGILVDETLETNVRDIYAIGDCAEFHQALPDRRKIEQVWYTGKMQGETVAASITGNAKTYAPGIWFNSAKFLDIEYQIYGEIPTQTPDTIHTLYWEHPEGRKSIRINYHKETLQVTGFQTMGIRYRHLVCDKWLSEGSDIKTVLTHLSAANYDPEFFSKYEKELIAIYNKQNPGSAIKLKSRSALSKLIFG